MDPNYPNRIIGASEQGASAQLGAKSPGARWLAYGLVYIAEAGWDLPAQHRVDSKLIR